MNVMSGIACCTRSVKEKLHVFYKSTQQPKKGVPEKIKACNVDSALSTLAFVQSVQGSRVKSSSTTPPKPL